MDDSKQITALIQCLNGVFASYDRTDRNGEPSSVTDALHRIADAIFLLGEKIEGINQ